MLSNSVHNYILLNLSSNNSFSKSERKSANFNSELNVTSTSTKAHIIKDIKTLEKQTFAKNEAMDIDFELVKQSTLCWALYALPEDNQEISLELTFLAQHASFSPDFLKSNSFHSMKDFLAGYLVCQVTPREKSLKVNKLCISPSYRKLGLATHILSQLMTKACLNSLSPESFNKVPLDTPSIKGELKLPKTVFNYKLILQVDPVNVEAYRLYNCLGFKKTKIINNYYGLGRDAHILIY